MGRWLGVLEVQRSSVRWVSLRMSQRSRLPPVVLELVGPEDGFRVYLDSHSDSWTKDATHGAIPWVLPKFSRDPMQQ